MINKTLLVKAAAIFSITLYRTFASSGQPTSPTASLEIKTGMVTGNFVHPTTLLRTRYFGVGLQDLNYGSGWFTGPTEGGEMNFAPEQ